jgi:hypothetical protein
MSKPKKVAASVSLPLGLYEQFMENLEERGFTEKGDFSHEFNRALHLYLERIGAFEVVAEADRRREEEDEKRRKMEKAMRFFNVDTNID